MSSLFLSLRFTFSYLLLTSLSLLGNYINVELFLGMHFIFGSIFLLLIIHYFGIKLAVLAAFISSFHTVLLWGSPYSMIITVIETAIVGIFYYRVKNNLMLGQVVYLVIIGIPLGYLFGIVFEGYDTLTTTLIMLKVGINTLINVTIANLLIILIEISKVVKITRKISLQEILLNLMLIFFLIPIVCALIVFGKSGLVETENQIINQLEETINTLSYEINRIYHNTLTPLMGIADRISLLENDLDERKEIISDLMLVQSSFPVFEAIYVSNQNGEIVHSYSPTENGPYTYNFQDSYSKDQIDQYGGYISNIIEMDNPNLQNSLVSVTVPIKRNGQTEGYVVGLINSLVYIQSINESKKGLMAVTIVDRNDMVIATNDLSQLPTNKLKLVGSEYFYDNSNEKAIVDLIKSPQEWSNLSYSHISKISHEVPWSIHVKHPVSYYTAHLYKHFVQMLLIAFIMSCVALLLSFLLSKWIQNSFTKVAEITSHFPTKIRGNEKVQWPEMRIVEISDIVDNFKLSEENLRNMFNEIVVAKQDLEFLAHYDQLTKLYNRTYVVNKFSELVESCTPKKLAVIFLDLDRFKIVNDTLGHEAGDKLLIEVAQRLRDVSSESYVISRLGGDEFIILAPVGTEELELNYVAKKIVQSLAEPYRLKEHEYHLSASIGICMFPKDGEDIHTLMKNAELSMYFAKDAGKNNYQFYNDEMNNDVVSVVKMENELRFAIERQQLHLYYQPQVDLQTGIVVGVEALVRWIHPTLGFVSPATFIPVAEETGMIIQIGNWILRKACIDLSSFQTNGWTELTMSVNISMTQFLHYQLVQFIRGALAYSQLDPVFLKLEITESVAMSQPNQVIAKLHELKGMGVELALDDFGTGYSSLNYLKRLPVDVLKMDKAFIQEIVHDKDDRTIVKAIIEVAHSLNMVVIAEGVETLEQLEMLKEFKCNQMQGYYFSKPVPKDEIHTLLKKHMNIKSEIVLK